MSECPFLRAASHMIYVDGVFVAIMPDWTSLGYIEPFVTVHNLNVFEVEKDYGFLLVTGKYEIKTPTDVSTLSNGHRVSSRLLNDGANCSHSKLAFKSLYTWVKRKTTG